MNKLQALQKTLNCFILHLFTLIIRLLSVHGNILLLYNFNNSI